MWIALRYVSIIIIIIIWFYVHKYNKVFDKNCEYDYISRYLLLENNSYLHFLN